MARSLCLLILLISMQPAWSAVEGEFLIFPHFDGIYLSGQADDPHRTDNELAPGVDFFVTARVGKFQMLAEYFLNEDESELERAQIGWGIGEWRIWLGRFHNPVGIWNFNYHHGAYLQTSINRPGIAEFEDDGGVFPVHLTGLLIEGIHVYGDQGIAYELAIGKGAGFNNTDNALEPLNLLDPSEGEQKLSSTVRLAYLPDAMGTDKIGVFSSYSTIPGIGSPVEEIKQRLLGIFIDWSVQRWRFTSELYYSRSRIKSPLRNLTSSFVTGYLQAEYLFQPDWTAYGRFEDNSSDRADPYLGLFPNYIATRHTVGINYRIGKRHTIKLELAKTESITDQFGVLTLQWSTVLP